MSDALSQKIAERREERDKLLRHLERVEVELAALELAANLRPVNDLSAAVRRTNSVGAEPRGKGRQFGAISKNWRTVLAMMAELYPDGASDDNIAELARAQGLQNLRPRDARHRMRSFQTHTFVEESPKGWRVTKVATDRFGFDSHPHNETAFAVVRRSKVRALVVKWAFLDHATNGTQRKEARLWCATYRQLG